MPPFKFRLQTHDLKVRNIFSFINGRNMLLAVAVGGEETYRVKKYENVT